MTTLELEFRTATVAGVSFPKRIIEMVVMPYESETTIDHRGRRFTEIVSHGAFDGVQQRAAQVKVNLDHDRLRVVGKTVALHPSRQEGLVAEVRITAAAEGEDVLIKADEGLLDASAGFGLLVDKQTGKVKQDAEVWESQTRRRLNHLYLDHIALTPDAAYKDAKVLAVRTAEQPAGMVGATPNRDRLELDRYRRLAADLDRRYHLSR